MRTPKTAKADVSFIRQETQFTCCAASLASALKAHGKDVTEAGVNKVLGASPMGGATWEAMLATVQYFGLRGTLVVPSTIAQLKAWTDAGIPVVIGWNPEGRPWSHASTVFHVDDDHTVHIMDPNIPDPSETVRVVPKAEFYKKWYEAIGDKLIVRRPAMAVEREVTVDGRQVRAGKKELRSQKDRGMSRFLQHGPVRPVDKSDTQSAMSKAQWELRKEEGRAGLPGAGMGAGYHKDKSRYDRGHGKSVEREAGSLTQPLMTRRDYGAVTARDYASILKLAVNLPADVERYVEEGTDAGMPEDKAWAVAWSRYCKYKNPESEHCQMNKSEYFPGRKAKFERGVSMTVDEVAEVVGDEFREMNEDPPESVKKVMEGMQGKTAGADEAEGLQKAMKASQKMLDTLKAQKLPENIEAPLRKALESNLAKYEAQLKSLKTAHRSPLLAMEQFADMLRDGKFEEGVPADPTENMSPEDAAEWERQTEEHKDEFKTADLESTLHRDDDGTVPFDLFFNRTAAVTAGGKYGFTKGTESACGVGVNKLQKSASRIAKALYAKDEGSPAFLAKHAARAGSKTASMLLKAMESIGPMAALAKNGKTAGKSGTGLYGFSEKTAKLGLDACTALHHEAGMIAGDLFARKGADPVKVAGYLAANAKKGKCAYSAMLGECSPDVAVEVTGTVKPSKKASDFLASDDTAEDDEVADIISKC